MDIIEKYKEVVMGYLDAPDVFIETSAYHLVSSLLGRFFRCSSLPGKDSNKPNTWFIISSIPGRTRRSTVANYTTYVYTKTSKMFQHSVKPSVEEEEIKKNVYETIIEEGTPEGIVDHITISKHDFYTIMSTEFGSVLKNMFGKEWHAGVATLFSKMYSGEPYTYMLSQRGKDKQNRYLPGGLYVTMFVGMQEPHLYITPEASRQGLLRRMVLVYCDPSDITRWIAPLNPSRESIFTELYEISEEIHNRMIDFRTKSMQLRPASIDISFMPDAMNIINEIAKINDEKLRLEVNNINIYRQSFWEHYAKLAMLHSISRGGIDIVRGKWRVNVRKEDVDKAMDFLNRATKYSSDIISNLGRIDEPIQTARSPLERVYVTISEYGKEGIDRNKLYRKLHMRANLLEEYIRTLQLQERIIIVDDITTGGVPRILYKVKD